METKGVTCKIPLELHNQISEEIRETESTMSKFIEMVIREHYEKGANKVMEKGRTLAFQVSEELFQKVKEYLDLYEKTYHRRLTQKEFVIGLIEQALEEAETDVKYQGYIQKEKEQIEQFNKMEHRRLPDDIDYDRIGGLRIEARQKLGKIRPRNLGQASRISGVSPADVTVLIVYLAQNKTDDE